jgi:hypothetical protein
VPLNYCCRCCSRYQIEGAFDSEKVIEKKLKAAAKFQSAEEEAAIRKRELQTLKTAVVVVSESEVSEVSVELMSTNSADVETTGVSVAALTQSLFAPKEIDLITGNIANDAAFLSPGRQMSKRSSVMNRTNPDLLNTLNNMFSKTMPLPAGDKTPTRNSNRRFSVAVPTSIAKSGLFSPGENVADAENKRDLTKKSKSKLLQRMLGIDDKPAEIVLSARPQMSFLDQLKARAMGKSETPSESIVRPPNPFAAAAATGGAMSFLEQIKSRRKEVDTSAVHESEGIAAVPEVVVTPPLPPVRNMLFGAGGGGGMSFLEQIKSRRKEE